MSSELSPFVIDVNFDISRDNHLFEAAMPRRSIYNMQSKRIDDLSGIKYALMWKPDATLFQRMPDLEVIFSLGAGVDNLLATPNLPDLPIVRFVDQGLTNRMSEWVCLQSLMHLRQMPACSSDQLSKEWNSIPHPQANEVNVGIMGIGILGRDAARKLSILGFNVAGWSRSLKQIDGIECYDFEGLDAFLARTHYLVGLLPYTPETEGIFNRQLFEKLNRNCPTGGPIFMNAGRGGSQNEGDIVSCIADGTLGGASLDVFITEPLDETSPLWSTENVIITPHTASEADSLSMAKYVASQIKRYEAGEPLENLVDRARGY